MKRERCCALHPSPRQVFALELLKFQLLPSFISAVIRKTYIRYPILEEISLDYHHLAHSLCRPGSKIPSLICFPSCLKLSLLFKSVRPADKGRNFISQTVFQLHAYLEKITLEWPWPRLIIMQHWWCKCTTFHMVMFVVDKPCWRQHCTLHLYAVQWKRLQLLWHILAVGCKETITDCSMPGLAGRTLNTLLRAYM